MEAMTRRLGAAAAAILLLGGCTFFRTNILGENWEGAAVEAKGKRVAILPFTDGAGVRSRGLGLEVARALPAALGKNASSIVVVSPDESLRALGKLDWFGTPRGELGRRIGADFVLSGEITAFQLQEPGTIGVYNGRLEIHAEVVNVDAGGTVAMARKKFEAVFPREGEHRQGSMLAEEAEIHRDLVDQMAERLAEIFYEHRVYKDDEPEFRPPWK
jgi:hypothetical protein